MEVLFDKQLNAVLLIEAKYLLPILILQLTLVYCLKISIQFSMGTTYLYLYLLWLLTSRKYRPVNFIQLCIVCLDAVYLLLYFCIRFPFLRHTRIGLERNWQGLTQGVSSDIIVYQHQQPQQCWRRISWSNHYA